MKDKNVKRLWNTNTKKFIEEFAILQTVNSDGNIEHTYFERNPKTLELERLSTCHIEEQNCSGMKDKNGKLIYEGYIVKLSSGAIGFIAFECQAYAIRFSKKDKYRRVGLGAYQSKELEIIGNIYENPELLKEVE